MKKNETSIAQNAMDRLERLNAIFTRLDMYLDTCSNYLDIIHKIQVANLSPQKRR